MKNSNWELETADSSRLSFLSQGRVFCNSSVLMVSTKRLGSSFLSSSSSSFDFWTEQLLEVPRIKWSIQNEGFPPAFSTPLSKREIGSTKILNCNLLLEAWIWYVVDVRQWSSLHSSSHSKRNSSSFLYLLVELLLSLATGQSNYATRIPSKLILLILENTWTSRHFIHWESWSRCWICSSKDVEDAQKLGSAYWFSISSIFGRCMCCWK